MSDLPKISIVTPSYNQGKFLEETILSVITQNYPNLEYILIDGGSSDNSLDIIKKHEHSISYWISEKDKGQSEAINKGLQKATGDIVAWLNSDDLYTPNTLFNISKIFQENPDIDLIYGNVENFHSEKGSFVTNVSEFKPSDFLSRVSIHQPSVFWKRKVHHEIGYLDESLYYTMDYDLWARMFFRYKTKKINQVFSRFRIHSTSKTNNNPPGIYLDSRIVFSRFINSFPSKEYKEKMVDMNIYHNSDEKSYVISSPPAASQMKIIFDNYVFNCAIQEYSFGSRQKANRLFYKVLPIKPTLAFYYIILNNFRLILDFFNLPKNKIEFK